MDNFQLCKNEVNQPQSLQSGEYQSAKTEKFASLQTSTTMSIVSSVSAQLQTSQYSTINKSEVCISTPSSSRKRISRNAETSNVIWKPLLPRPPTPIVPAKRRLPTPPPVISSAPGTPPIEEDSNSPPADTDTPSTVKSDLMPMLLEAAAHAALRDKRQERMVKNRAAAYESRKRKREEAERLMAENLEMKSHIRELQHKIAELTVENEQLKQLLATKN